MKTIFNLFLLLCSVTVFASSSSKPNNSKLERFVAVLNSFDRADYSVHAKLGYKSKSDDAVAKQMAAILETHCEVENSKEDSDFSEKISGNNCPIDYVNRSLENGALKATYSVLTDSYKNLNQTVQFDLETSVTKNIKDNGNEFFVNQTGWLQNSNYSSNINHNMNVIYKYDEKVFDGAIGLQYEFAEHDVSLLELFIKGHFENDKQVTDSFECKFDGKPLDCKSLNLASLKTLTPF